MFIITSCATLGCENDKRGTGSYCSSCYSKTNTLKKCNDLNCNENRYHSHSYCRVHYIEYRRNRPDYSRRRRNTQLKGLYGITLNQFENKVAEQNNKCEICKQTVLIDSKGLTKACVDHNHKTGQVRGIICNTCNLCIGRIGESKEILYSMIAYLEKYESSETICQTSNDEDIVRTV